MSVEPNFDGFRDAQVRLREKFGRDLYFYTPTSTTYASGTQLDPESGEPYDPTILPVASGFASASARVSVVSRPMGLSRRGIDDAVQRTAIGWLEAGGIVLIVDVADWPAIEDATEVEYGDERYVIRQTDHDYLGPVDRYLIYASQA